MSKEFPGQSHIMDYIVSIASDALPESSQSSIEKIRDLIVRYAKNDLTREQVKNILLEYVSTTSFLDIMDQIYKYDVDSRDPIEQLPSSPIDDVSHTSRRPAVPWTQAEDIRLLAGILRHGTESWSIISDVVGPSRTRAQCSQRWFRGLDPRISKKRWTEEDEQKLLKFVREYGETAWSKIASSMGNRSDVQCRYHYLQLKKSMKKSKKGHKVSSKRTVAENSQQCKASDVKPKKTKNVVKESELEILKDKEITPKTTILFEPLEPVVNPLLFRGILSTGCIETFLNHFGC